MTLHRNYRVPNEKRDVVKELTTAAAKSSEVYLATDLPIGKVRRSPGISTKFSALHPSRHAVSSSTRLPSQPSMKHLPILERSTWIWWMRSRRGVCSTGWLATTSAHPVAQGSSRLSAGRVQSVALRLIVEREREIESFVPEEY